MGDLIDSDEIVAFLARTSNKKTGFIYSIEEEEWIDGEFSFEFENEKVA